MAQIETKHTNFAPDNPPVSASQKSSPTLGGGIGAGYYKSRKFGFEGFSFGLNYSRYHVDYSSTIHYLTGKSVTGSAFTDLKYINLPVTARLALGKLHKFQFFIDGGVYGSALVDYKERANLPGAYIITYNNDNYLDGRGKIKLDHGLYKKWDWGLVGAIGAKYSYNPKVSFSATFQIVNSLVKDIEDRNPMKSKLGVGSGTYIFWDGFVYKGLAATYVGLAGKRGNTQVRAFGIQINCNFTI